MIIFVRTKGLEMWRNQISKRLLLVSTYGCVRGLLCCGSAQPQLCLLKLRNCLLLCLLLLLYAMLPCLLLLALLQSAACVCVRSIIFTQKRREKFRRKKTEQCFGTKNSITPLPFLPSLFVAPQLPFSCLAYIRCCSAMIAFSTINAHRKQNEVSIRDFWIEVPVEWNGMDGVYLSVPQSSKSFNLCLCQYTLPKLNSFHLMLGACVKVKVVEYSEKEIVFKTVYLYLQYYCQSHFDRIRGFNFEEPNQTILFFKSRWSLVNFTIQQNHLTVIRNLI